MSDFSVILKRVRTNLLEGGMRYIKAATTSAGSATGSTMISTTLTEFDDAWNNMVCHILSGDNIGLKKTVEDFTASTDTLTFTNNVWPAQVATTVDFELFEPGIWDGDDLKRIIEKAANTFLRLAPDDMLQNYVLQGDSSSTSGLCTLPSKMLKLVHPHVLVNDKPCAVISPNRASQFDRDPYIPSTPGNNFIGYFLGRSAPSVQVGQFKHKPATEATVTFNYVPVASFNTAGTWEIDEAIWEPIEFLATSIALAANEQTDLANYWQEKALFFLPEQHGVTKAIEEVI